MKLTLACVVVLGVALGVAPAGCARELLPEGDECVATSQCAQGLICDLAGTPHVCSSQGTRPPDAGPAAPDADPAVPDAPPAPIDAAPDAAPDAMALQ